MVIAGWVVLGLFSLFMIGASAVPKLFGMAPARDSFSQIGWSDQHILWIGVLEAVLTLLVLFPRTSLIGGVLMMSLLGGALASNLRADMPLFSHVLFSVYLGILMWVGIWLRSPELREVLMPGRGRLF